MKLSHPKERVGKKGKDRKDSETKPKLVGRVVEAKELVRHLPSRPQDEPRDWGTEGAFVEHFRGHLILHGKGKGNDVVVVIHPDDADIPKRGGQEQ